MTLRRLLPAVLAASLLAFAAGAFAAGQCSPQVGKVTLNEYNYIDNFSEIAVLDMGVSVAGWKVGVYQSNKSASRSLPSSGADFCFGGAFQVSQFTPAEIAQNADIVLFDTNDDVVDIVRVRTSLPVSTAFYPTAVPACAFVKPPYDLLVSSASKGVDRMPSESGSWRNTPGVGSNSYQSRCAPNIIGGNADLVVTKTASAGSVAKGSAVSFTVVVSNAGPESAINVWLNDVLPGGLGYSSHSVSKGAYTASSGTWGIGNMAAGESATLTLIATATTVGSWTNTAVVTSQTFDPNRANNSASASVSVPSPGATLDAVEVAAAAGTPIRTKLAAAGFSLDLVALDAAGAIDTNYNKTVTVQLVDASSSGSCSAMSVLQNSGSYNFTSSDNGRKTFAFNYPGAARNVRVRMTDNSNPTNIVACSSDNFAIRPTGFAVSSPLSGAVKAGSDFTIAAVAKNNAGANIAYTGTPNLDGANVLDHNGVAAADTTTSRLSDTSNLRPPPPLTTLPFSSSASGVFRYHDVGTITLLANAVIDTSFTGVDSSKAPADCVTGSASNTPSAGLYGCSIGAPGAGPYGRFYPDHFSYSAVLTPACAGKFTYMDDPRLGVSLTLAAKSSDGTTTRSYSASDYATLSLSAPSCAISGDNAGSPINVGTGGRLAPVISCAYTAGAYTIAAGSPYSFARPISNPADASWGPYESFILQAAVSDPDGASISGGTSSNVTAIRYGRLRLSSAYGSKDLPLVLPTQVQYWQGSYWSLNGDDSGGAAAGCTSLPAATIAASGATISASPPAPYASNAGLFTLSLGSSGAGYADVSFVTDPWLKFSWKGAGPVDPTARAEFGIYKGAHRFIYRREVR